MSISSKAFPALLTLLLATSSAHSIGASLESPPAPPPPEDSTPTAPIQTAQQGGGEGFTEVVVTAQKRSESIKDIPIAVTALKGEALEEQHIANYEDLSRAEPGINFASGGYGVGTGLTNIEIRGVSSISGAATVGVYIDEIPVTVTNFFDGTTQPKLFDLDRIETLRGPQGTLFGASSEGGTVRFITAQPDLNTFSGSVSSSLSHTERASTLSTEDTAVLNVPIIPDKLALRAAFDYTFDAGWINQFNDTYTTVLDKGSNTEKDLAVHANLLFVPEDDLTIKFGLTVQQNKMGDSPAFFINATNPPPPPFYTAHGIWDQDKFIQEWDTDKFILGSVTANYDLGFADLTSATGFFQRTLNRQQDGTLYNSFAFATLFLDPALQLPGPLSPNPLVDSEIGSIASPIHLTSNYKQYSEEIRLTSKSAAETGLPLTWVTGIYFSDQIDQFGNFQVIPGINSTFQKIFGSPLNSSTQLAAILNSFAGSNIVSTPYNFFPNDSDEGLAEHYDQRNYAGFAQANFQILPNLNASVGLRYEMANFSFSSQNFGFYLIGAPNASSGTDYYSMTPKFTLTYDVTPDSNIYATIGKGVRFGGPNAPIPNSVCGGDLANIGLTAGPAKYDTDKLWSYELGTKNRLLNNHLSINAAAYYIDWDNIQQNYWLPTCGYFVTLNVGNAASYGGEVEIRYQPIRGLTFGASATLDHAQIVSTLNPLAVAVGARVLNTPDYTFVFSTEYTHPILDDKVGFIRTDYSYTGDSYGSYQNYNTNYHNRGYGVLNASIGVDWDAWEVSVFGKNLMNDRKTIQTPEVNTLTEGYTVHPMVFGAMAKFKF